MSTETSNTQLVKSKPKALEIMASRLNVDPAKLLDTLKATVFKGATNEELLVLVAVANEYNLSPFLKEIFAFPAKGGGIVPVVSVDGWTKLMNRSDNFDGIEFTFEEGKDDKPISCTATIWLKNRTKPVKVTEYYSECFRATEPWKTMPRRMLRHKALIQVCRMGFGFAGINDEDEGRAQSEERFINATQVIDQPAPKAIEETKAAPVLTKTARMQDLCKKQNIKVEDALTVFGEMGFASFEDANTRFIESAIEHPELFVSKVKQASQLAVKE